MSLTLLEAAKAKLEGKRVEFSYKDNYWCSWNGKDWDNECEYRIAPEPKKKVKFHCWYDGDQVFWLREKVEPKWPSTRVSSEDKEIEIEV